MGIKRVVPNITSGCIEESREFYVTLLGFGAAMDMGWIVTLSSPGNPAAQISLVRGEASSAEPPRMTVTIEVSDVDEVHARAVSRGDPIVYPLTDEPWGVRRFHVADPNGVIINVMSHVAQERPG